MRKYSKMIMYPLKDTITGKNLLAGDVKLQSYMEDVI